MDICALNKRTVMSDSPFSFGFSCETDTSEVKPLNGTLWKNNKDESIRNKQLGTGELTPTLIPCSVAELE